MATKSIKKRNKFAKDLFSTKYKVRIVKPKKGTEMSSKIIQQIGARL